MSKKENNIIISIAILLTTIILTLTISTTYALPTRCYWNIIKTLNTVSEKLYKEISKELNIKNIHNTLVLTNVKYITVGGYSLYPLIYYFILNGFEIPYNLIPIHSISIENPWIFTYNNSTKYAIFVEFNRTCIYDILKSLCSGEISSRDASYRIYHGCIIKFDKFNFNISKILYRGLENPNLEWKYITTHTSEDSAFSIITITTVWSYGAPPELFLAAELHNHICPGLLSGYLMYRYLILRKLLKEGYKVYIIASPVYCKDDVYVQLLDATPGKRRIVVKLLNWTEQDEISKILGGNVAGIVIMYNEHADNGVAYILAFNWTKVHIYLKKFKISFHGSTWWISRIIADIYMLKYVNNPSYFVKILKIIYFKGHVWRYPSLFYKLGLAGRDPYVVLGVLKISKPALKSHKYTPTTVKTSRYVSRYSVSIFIPIVEGIVIAILIALCSYLYVKYRSLKR